MKTLLMCALLLAPLAAQAAKKAAAKPKPATIQQLIDATMKKGEAGTLENPLAAKLGYSSPMKIRDFPIADIAQDSQVGSVVILGPDGKPAELNIALTTITEKSGETPVAIDGYTYRADLKGKFISSVHAHGKLGDGFKQDVETGAAAKKGYDKLLKTILARPEILAP